MLLHLRKNRDKHFEKLRQKINRSLPKMINDKEEQVSDLQLSFVWQKNKYGTGLNVYNKLLKKNSPGGAVPAACTNLINGPVLEICKGLSK